MSSEVMTTSAAEPNDSVTLDVDVATVGCELSQGYLYAKAMSASDLVTLRSSPGDQASLADFG